MAPSSTKPKSGGATTDTQASTDSGRHGSSRDHPVSVKCIRLCLKLIDSSPRVMIDAATAAIENVRMTDGAHVLLDTEVRDHPVVKVM